MDRFAPNGVVRRRVIKADERFRDLIGKPTPLMELISSSVEQKALKFKKKHMFDPFNRRPREEPAKIYLYEKDGSIKDEDIPYKTIIPNEIPKKIKEEMEASENFYKNIAESYMSPGRKSMVKNDLDQIILDNISGRTYGGFKFFFFNCN